MRFSLSRRGFFKGAATAAAAGPLAVSAVAETVTSMSVLGPASMLADECVPGGSLSAPSWSGEKDWVLGRLKELALGPEPVPQEWVMRLDPDLVANRSMSLATRTRIQAQRMMVRRHEREKQSLVERLTKL